MKLLAVSPTGLPWSSRQVTTVTPVAKQPSASRKVRGSEPVRYSRETGASVIAGRHSGLRPPMSRREPLQALKVERLPAHRPQSSRANPTRNRAAGTHRCGRPSRRHP